MKKAKSIKLTRKEQKIVDNIPSCATFRVTKTILTKNIQDCNSSLRQLLKDQEVVDMDELKAGQGIKVEGTFLDGSETIISIYRSQSRGDKRIWFKGLKEYADANDVMAMFFKDGKIVLQNVTKATMVALFVVTSSVGVL